MSYPVTVICNWESVCSDSKTTIARALKSQIGTFTQCKILKISDHHRRKYLERKSISKKSEYTHTLPIDQKYSEWKMENMALWSHFRKLQKKQKKEK